MIKLEDMSFDELINYWHGRLCIAIGEGNSRTCINMMLQSTLQMGYNNANKKKVKRKS